jgi:hypothetical protein
MPSREPSRGRPHESAAGLARGPAAGVPRARTGLAWERSAFSLAAVAGLAVTIAAHRDAPGLLVLSVALLAVAGAVWRKSRSEYERTTIVAQPRAIGLLTLVTAATALVAAAVVLAPL